jgi:hypothetical protein
MQSLSLWQFPGVVLASVVDNKSEIIQGYVRYNKVQEFVVLNVKNIYDQCNQSIKMRSYKFKSCVRKQIMKVIFSF